MNSSVTERARRGIGALARLRLGALLCALAIAAHEVGCAGPLAIGTRSVRTPVFQEQRVRVFLRHREEARAPIQMNFEHPRTISSIRLSRILGALDIRERDRKEERGERKAAFSLPLAQLVGKGMSLALARATSEQEVVVMAIEERKRLGLFSADYLTSLVAWVKDEHLWIVFAEVDARLSDDPSEKPREPTRAGGKGFRTLPSEGIRSVAPTTAVASWRDPVFSKSAATRTKTGSRELRRTILMEEAGARDELESDGDTGSLSPATLRALADLEERRLSGKLSEAAYREERARIVATDE